MSTRSDILTALRQVLGERRTICVMHSSLAHLSPSNPLSPFDILFSIKQLTTEGWTFALPAFTFSFFSTGMFSVVDSPSETGILADWLLKYLPHSRRTQHPIYSFSTIGPEADLIHGCNSETTWGSGSPFELFEKVNARIVMLGCGWDYCTQIHRYEEMAAVPYRYFKDFTGVTRVGDKTYPARARMFVRDLILNPQVDPNVVLEKLRCHEAISEAPLFRGRVQSVDCRAISDEATRLLSQNPLHLLSNSTHVAWHLSCRTEAHLQPCVRAVILADHNTSMLEKALIEQLETHLPERRILLHSIPFGQMTTEILDPSSALNTFSPELRIFCNRWEDLTPSRDFRSLLNATLAYAALISTLHSKVRGWTIVHRFALLDFNQHADLTAELSDTVSQLNFALTDALSGLGQIAWVDTAAEAARHTQEVLDRRLWYLGKFVFSTSFSQQISKAWLGLTLAAIAKTTRLIIVDLDNTLWGGVIGEDGLEGIQLGGDYPGNAFFDFQQALKNLSSRGVALAVVSKNDEDVAKKAIQSHPQMHIRLDDIATYRINWRPKWQNIQEIAEELNLSAGSVLFIDDNPVEREQVRSALPQVKILDLPPDPTLYVQALSTCPFLASCQKTTEEDLTRSKNLRALKEFKARSTKPNDLDTYLTSLNIEIHFRRLSEGNLQRAAQLCQKTNQFNTTSRRYDASDLKSLANSGSDVVVVGYKDRLTELENIGLIILTEDGPSSGRIDLLLLSCRVLGRGLEKALPTWAVDRALGRGWRKLAASIIETERNTPVRSVYRDAGFALGQNGRWLIEPRAGTAYPQWLRVINEFSTGEYQ